MKTWNLLSAFTTLHNGIDIYCNANAVVKSPVNGYITAITDNSITIQSLPIPTYDVSGNFIVTVTLGNVQPLEFTVNQIVTRELQLGNVVNSEYCGNIGATNYLHISVYITIPLTEWLSPPRIGRGHRPCAVRRHSRRASH